MNLKQINYEEHTDDDSVETDDGDKLKTRNGGKLN